MISDLLFIEQCRKKDILHFRMGLRRLRPMMAGLLDDFLNLCLGEFDPISALRYQEVLQWGVLGQLLDTVSG